MLSVWVGMHETSGATTGKLAQGGSISFRRCKWNVDIGLGDFGGIEFECQNGQAAFYEFLPQPAVFCDMPGDVNTGDNLESILSRSMSSGKLTNNYTIAVYNNTRGKVCASTSTYAMSESYFASIIAEPTQDFDTGSLSTLPSFDDISFSDNVLSDGSSTFKLSRIVNNFAPAGQADAIKYTLYAKGTKQSILIGDLLSDNSFMQYYLTSK
jgi:hypothetical protein